MYIYPSNIKTQMSKYCTFAVVGQIGWSGQYWAVHKLHPIPFYKKCSYKKRPIKFFNHKKRWPIESFGHKKQIFWKKLRNGIAIEIFSKRCQKATNLIKTNANQPKEMLKLRKISRFIWNKEAFVLFKKRFEKFKKRRP